jgi:urease accessory protein UreE
MNRRPAPGKRRRIEQVVAELRTDDDTRQRLHALNNTLASMRLRMGILATDPGCLVRQEENIQALIAIADEAIQMVRELQAASTTDLGKGGGPRRLRRAAGGR